MDLEFSGEVWFWRGPSPYHFVTVPEEESAALQATSAQVTYGWGMIPVAAQVGKTGWTTFDPASQPYGPDEVRKERTLYGNRAEKL